MIAGEGRKETLQEQFGAIDIYLFDQMLRGNITPGMRIVDAGCGFGRNLHYLLREGAEVFAVDQNPEAVAYVRRMAVELGTELPERNFRVGAVESMPFPDALGDAVICSAVLHFARDEAHFRAMLKDLWRVLRPGGVLFCRLGSRIGMEFERISGRVYRVGGAAWFLVDERMLMDCTAELGGQLVDPLKTTVVQGQRCMTTWVVRKQ